MTDTLPSATPVAPPPVYAGFWVRTAATLVDSVLYGIPLAILSYWLPSGPGPIPALLGFLVNWLIPGIVTILFWHYRGATPGKMAFGLRIVDVKTGGAPTTTHLVNRYLAYFVSFFVLCLGFLWVIWDKRKQGWHDIFVDTAVVRVEATERKTPWLGIAALIVILLAGLALGGLYFVRRKLPGLQAASAQSEAEGRAFGKGKSQMDCLRAGFERDAAQDSFAGHINANMYLAGCLDESTRAPEFCAGIPLESDLAKTTNWRLSLCQSIGRTDNYCPQLLASVQRHCEGKFKPVRS